MAEQNITANNDSTSGGRRFTHIRRVKDFPQLVLSLQLGHRYELFRGKVNDGEQECTLTLFLYPGGYDDEHSDQIAIRASLDRKIQCKVTVDLAICGRDNEEHFHRRIVLTEENYDRALITDFVGKSVVLNTAGLLHNNEQLKVLCRLVIDNGDSESGAAELLSKHRHEQMDNYQNLFENGDFSDFELIVGETTLKVHKCILASHSSVFAALFLSDMSEKNEASTKIEDVDVETMRELLRFIYVGKVEKLEELASSLWVAADKYDLGPLKSVCEQQLIEQLSVNNILETLCFLNTYNASKLKTTAIQVIIDNVEIVSDDSKFKGTLKTLSSDLLSEVLVIMCDSLKKAKMDVR